MTILFKGAVGGYVVEKVKKKRYYRGLQLNSKKLAGRLKIHRVQF